jgi:hypothetical protein
MNQKDPGLALSRNSDGSRAANADGAPRKHGAFHSSQPRARKALPHVILRGATGSSPRGRTNARPITGSARPDARLRAVSKDLAPNRKHCRCASASPRRDAPELCMNHSPRKKRAWGMPGARCTRSLACSVKNTRVSHHGRTGTPGIPARNGFNGFLRALPGDRACLSPSLADKASLRPVGPTCLRKLDAGVEASGPHDFAVRSNISRQRAL